MKGKKSETPFLPQDVITRILVRLPVKSVGRFRCVSKPWKSLLASPGFIKAHLNFHRNEPQHFIFTFKSSYSTSPHILTFTPGSSCDAISRKVNFTFEEKPFVGVNNSCHGLVLLIDWKAKFSTFLMNPITLEAMQVPDPGGPFSMCCSLGLGYDGSSDDYKIVSLDGLGNFVDIYSVKAKTWRRTGGFSCCLRPSYYGNFNPGIYKNGCLHWIAYDDRTAGIPRPVILALSLASMEFKEVPFPSVVQYDNSDALDIIFLDGCLALVRCSCRRGSVDVWIMKEYGVRTSWTEPIIINCSDHYEEECEVRVVCLLGEDEIVLENYSRMMLVAYNWRNGAWRDLVVSGGVDSDDVRLLMPFRGSLLSPN